LHSNSKKKEEEEEEEERADTVVDISRAAWFHTTQFVKSVYDYRRSRWRQFCHHWAGLKPKPLHQRKTD